MANTSTKKRRHTRQSMRGCAVRNAVSYTHLDVYKRQVLLFPNRHRGLAGAARATTPLDRGGVQRTLRKVSEACGLKKRSPRTRFDTAMPPT